MKIDEAVIEQGKSLKRLLESEDFEPLLKEINERLSMYSGRIEGARVAGISDGQILSCLDRQQELKSLLSWIDEEIEMGGMEYAKKQAVAA